ncbi:Sec-independent protein secretion pathway component TatC [Caldisphaera lagunensis DSM 15908]|uniref:Sec-independent protein translocase protein TatC n=1 Tax=Caldisphaera lagunensis (strain DSM 15908 / JCM 11604 / ANMR 0165 / IC-154) TaxID=1056495 RepID=L0ACA0_CALLD|nr:twin-arginine translocase subunit TatC [Caldisphaera lagunensis]AFZ71054.1 Sec-independent protein secretion pathway component TatC [Caldisphaera lagunensis DSM 15908]
MQSSNSILNEYYKYFNELLRRLLIPAIFFIVILILIMFFKFNKIEIHKFYMYYPFPSLTNSTSVMILKKIKDFMLPKNMVLISVNAFDPIIGSLYTSSLISAIVTSPLWIYEIYAFIFPALTQKERKAINMFIIPSIILFIFGALFSYFIILPALFRFMYYLDLGLGVLPSLSIRAFISTVLSFVLLVGISFEYPIVIMALTYVGFVDYKTLLKYWRYAIALSFIIALIISPGATGGIIEITIGLTLSGLYFLGVLISKYLLRK